MRRQLFLFFSYFIPWNPLKNIYFPQFQRIKPWKRFWTRRKHIHYTRCLWKKGVEAFLVQLTSTGQVAPLKPSFWILGLLFILKHFSRLKRLNTHFFRDTLYKFCGEKKYCLKGGWEENWFFEKIYTSDFRKRGWFR